LSCKLLTNEAIGGNQGRDTLPIPVFPDAVTVEEMFSTNYDSEEKEKGQQARLYVWLCEMLTSYQPCLILLDSNDLLFGGDSLCRYSSVYEMLESKFGMIQIHHPYGNELVMYCETQLLHVVVVNRPFSIAGDARLLISLLRRVRRARSATILLNLVRLLEGRTPLDAYCPDDEFQNPINGILSSMIIQKGFHMRGVIPAAHYCEGISAKDTYALVENDISKLDSSGAAFSELLRRQRRKRLLLSESGSEPGRVNDTQLPLEFRATISQTVLGAVDVMFDKLYRRSQLGAVITGSAWSRMKIVLLDGVLEIDSPLRATLWEIWDDQKTRGGNPNATNTPDEIISATNATLPLFVEAHAESPTQVATPFWIRLEDSVPQLDPSSLGTLHPILNALTFKGLESRCTPRKSSGLAVGTVTAVKFTHLGANLVLPRQETDGYALVRLLPRKRRTRTQAQSDLEYNDFVPRHLDKEFWIRSTAAVVEELYMGDYDLADATSFPYGLEIFNGLVFEGLTKKCKRAGQYGLDRLKRSKKKKDFFLEHGYYKVKLKLRATRR
jgi:hypothetical protein